MVCQSLQSDIGVLHLAEGIFIDDVRVIRVLEDTWRDPRLAKGSSSGDGSQIMITDLKNKPATPANIIEDRDPIVR